jgi:hypothetical protein
MMQMEEEYVSPTTKRVTWALEILILVSGIFQTFFGETIIGILTLIFWALVTFPAVFTHNRITIIPLEIKLVFFIFVFLQFVVGEARDFYSEVPYYDKFVHTMGGVMIGFIGFLIVYTAHVYGKLKASLPVMALLIILVTVGFGGLWEIVEYLSDTILYPRIPGWHHFQGSLTEDPLTDTMNDLIVDTIGATIGALYGVWLIKREQRRESKRLPKLTEEIAQRGVKS